MNKLVEKRPRRKVYTFCHFPYPKLIYILIVHLWFVEFLLAMPGAVIISCPFTTYEIRNIIFLLHR